jgi:hypothetical protein
VADVELLTRFSGVSRAGAGHVARCPAHEDAKASLSISRGDNGGWLLYCHAGCKTETVVKAAGLAMSDLQPERLGTARKIVANYDYRDVAGALVFQVVRYEPKDFQQRRPDGAGGWIWKTKGIAPLVYRRAEIQGRDTVYVAEGEKDVDRLWSIGLPATCNPLGAGVGKWKAGHTQHLIAAGVRRVVVLPDNDAPGRAHADAVARSCTAAGLTVKTVAIPAPAKDITDWLDAGGTKTVLGDLVKSAATYQATAFADVTEDAVEPEPVRERPPIEPRTLAEADVIFRRWLGDEYDLDALHVVLATAAAEQLSGDPAWLLLIAGSGFTKTETVQALSGAGAIVTSTIASEGALLSGTSKKEKAKDATGGLLRRIGSHGLLVIKDVTSILTTSRDARHTVLSALREIHDQKWERNIGTDGGRSLTWTGRIVIIGACTTAWDRAHDVIASMGDRFVTVRMDSTKGRLVAGRQAISNTGHETTMRAELAAVVGGVLAGVDPSAAVEPTDDERERLLAAANVVTLARTGVDYDYRGDVIDAHAPEAPTRFAKQLAQVFRGAIAIGISREAALRLVIRCARDSMPPLRLAILADVAAHSGTLTRDCRQRLDKPRVTVDRQLQALHMLGLLTCTEEDGEHRGQPVTHWRYRLAPDIDPAVLNPDSVPDLAAYAHFTQIREIEPAEHGETTEHIPVAKSGTDTSAPDDLAAEPEYHDRTGGSDGFAY